MGTITQERSNKNTAVENSCYNWDIFGKEVPQFIYEYFTYALTPMDKLIFYGYFITGFTTLELAERIHKTSQYVSARIMRLERVMKYLWNKREQWSNHVNGSYHER